MDIKMPRGDIRTVHFTVTDDSGNDTSILFTEIYATFKKSYSSQQYLFQKKLSDGSIIMLDEGDYQFVIRPEDTDNLPFGTYVFDIELVYQDQIKQTFVGELKLTNEVTFASNEVTEDE